MQSKEQIFSSLQRRSTPSDLPNLQDETGPYIGFIANLIIPPHLSFNKWSLLYIINYYEKV
jgi:hypothetical protein